MQGVYVVESSKPGMYEIWRNGKGYLTEVPEEQVIDLLEWLREIEEATPTVH